MSRPAKTNAMIMHHPEAVTTDGPGVMGRHSAGEGFLKGFVRHAEVARFYGYTPKPEYYRDFRKRVAAFGGPNTKPTSWVSPDRLGDAGLPACLYCPGPGISELAWLRRRYGQRAFSVCGVTHTISSNRVMIKLGELLTGPVQGWDALICTSSSVRAAVNVVLDGYAGYLKQRLGVKVRNGVELPVIPLGVDTAAFAETASSAGIRETWRRKFGVADDDVAALFLGRLSFHAKAHPLPMLVALQRASRRSRHKVHLILAGKFPNAAIEAQFRAATADFCPDVNSIFVDSGPAENREGVWRAADIFVSLSDNVQESFGLTPIEAKAAGLPSVVSDWDGYRDTIRDGTDGFTIPTRLPEAPFGVDLAFAHAAEIDTYDRYIGHVSQCTAVDIDAATEALTRLIDHRELRRRMGDAARRDAKETFDWSVVVARYQELWAELDARRRTAPETGALRAGESASPLFDDPFSVFARHATSAITEKDRIAVTLADVGSALDRHLNHEMNRFASRFLLPRELCQSLLRDLEVYGPCTVGELARLIPDARRAPLVRTVAWLAKMGLVSFVQSGEAPIRSTELTALAAEQA
jgi:glycosyltransferase involved in cell wall biosynthesis